MRRGLRAGLTALGLFASCVPSGAADLLEPGGPRGPEATPVPRYFPRAEGDESALGRAVGSRRQVRCRVRRVPIPTDAPDDPSYVGSAYGLGKPSYYGFTPPLGFDDPYGRSLLPYCP